MPETPMQRQRITESAALLRHMRLTAPSTSLGEWMSPQADIDTWAALGLVRITGQHRCAGWVYWVPIAGSV